MNSLSDLNSFAATSVTFTDNRTPAVIFNRELALDQFVAVDTTVGVYTHVLKIGINIIDIIDPTTCATTYTVDLSAATGDATLTWATLPSGVTATTPSANVYRLSGINSKAIWDAIKTPTITIASTFAGAFTYTATIAYVGGASKIWNTAVSVFSFNILTAVRNNGYYLTNTESLITGGPLITDATHDGLGQYTMTVVPSPTSAIASLTSAGRTEWIEQTRITLPVNSSAVSKLSANGLWLVVAGESFAYPGNSAYNGYGKIYTRTDTSINTWTFFNNIGYGQVLSAGLGGDCAISSDGSTAAITSTLEANGTGGGEGKIYVYTKGSTSYSLQATINPTETGAADTTNIKISSDGNTIAAFLYAEDSNTVNDCIVIYTRSGSTWTKQTKIVPTGLPSIIRIYSYDLSADGQVLSIASGQFSYGSYKSSGAVWTYLRSGSTWTETTTILPSDVGNFKRFGYGAIRLNADGTELFANAFGFTTQNRNTPTITVSGNTTSSTAQKKFGAGSVFFDGTADYVTITQTVNSSNFTVECWLHRTADNKQQYVYRADFDRAIYFTSTNYLRWATGGSAPTEIQSTSTLAINTWYHIAVTYNSSTNVHTLYVNGVSQGTATSTISNSNTSISLGRYSASSGTTDFYQGYIDDFRLTQDQSSDAIVYTGNFTPPTAALTNYHGRDSSGTPTNMTKLLIHGDTNITDNYQGGQVLATQQSYIFTRTVDNWNQTYLLGYVNGVVSRDLTTVATDKTQITEITESTLIQSKTNNTTNTLDYFSVSDDGDLVFAFDNTNDQLVPFLRTATIGSSYNSTTKTLTLTGTRSEVNADIDQILITPATDYTSSFVLNYAVVTPTSDTENRNQTVYKQ